VLISVGSSEASNSPFLNASPSFTTTCWITPPFLKESTVSSSVVKVPVATMIEDVSVASNGSSRTGIVSVPDSDVLSWFLGPQAATVSNRKKPTVLCLKLFMAVSFDRDLLSKGVICLFAFEGCRCRQHLVHADHQRDPRRRVLIPGIHCF